MSRATGKQRSRFLRLRDRRWLATTTRRKFLARVAETNGNDAGFPVSVANENSIALCPAINFFWQMASAMGLK